MVRTLPAVLMVFAAAAQAAGAPNEKPQRIVSLNLCTDELVLRLAEPAHIGSITWLSRQPNSSNVADLAARTPVNHGLAEEIIPQAPDLVIAGVATARTAAALLKRAGVPVMELDVPSTLEETRAQIRAVAEALGERRRGEEIVAAMDARLAAVPAPAPGRRPTAVVLNPNGFTVGAGTLVDEILTRAGFENLGARPDVDRYGAVPLETIVLSRPDLLILNAARDGPPSLGTELLGHPALARLPGRTRTVVLPSRLWTCGGPAVVEAIERLAPIAAEIGRQPATQ